MFAAPGTTSPFGRQLTRDVATRIASNWWVLALNGLLMIVAGFLIFSIDWTVSSLSTFIGVVFIVEGVMRALISGVNGAAQRANVVSGLLSIAAGVVIIAWPSPGLVALAIFLAAWLIVIGTISLAGGFAARKLLPDWWLLPILGVLEIALGVLALANPGATLAAIVTVGGIWAVAAGVMRIVMAFQLKRLPDELDKAFVQPTNGAAAQTPTAVTPTAS
jgi:uncharacterized membrane protein HdeD (DUF308 family)